MASSPIRGSIPRLIYNAGIRKPINRMCAEIPGTEKKEKRDCSGYDLME
jgi:hypothetical protein